LPTALKRAYGPAFNRMGCEVAEPLTDLDQEALILPIPIVPFKEGVELTPWGLWRNRLMTREQLQAEFPDPRRV
jgi:hypothetical protein